MLETAPLKPAGGGKAAPATSARRAAVRSAKPSGLRRAMTAALFFAALIALWHFLVKAGVWSAVILPPPEAVGRFLLDSSGLSKALGWSYNPDVSGVLPGALWITTKRLLVGYLVGVVIGIPLGLVTARFQWAADTLGVLGLGLQTLPSVCWVPLALLWFGQTESAMQFVVIMGTLWSVAISTDNGVHNVPPIFARAARTMGSRGLHTWWRVILPASLPFIVSGIKQGWAFAWRSLMAAEIYVTILTGFGLGHLLHYGRELHAMDQVLGVMLVIVLIGLLADKILFSPWERFLHRRWGTMKA